MSFNFHKSNRIAIDEYRALYENLFPELRSFKFFKFLDLEMIFEVKIKNITTIARILELTGDATMYLNLQA